MTVTKHNDDLRCCFIQLYSDLQPVNAEPLSSEKLASALANALPHIAIQIYTLGTFQSQDQRAALVDEIGQAKYDLVGLSCPQGTYTIARETLARFSTYSPPHIVLGHALPTTLPDVFLRAYPRAVIVRGWGEDAIVALCRQLQNHLWRPKLIPGLTYIDEQGLRHDNPPAWSKPPLMTHRVTPQRYFARVEASRGCHYNVCTFCSRPPRDKNQPAWQRLDLSIVLTEIEHLVQTGITTFTFTDEDFIGNDPAGALEFAQQLRAFPNLDFALSLRADNVFIPHGSEEENQKRQRILQILKDAGLTLVFVGIESFAPAQLQRFGKGVSSDINIHVIHLLESLQIELELGLILFDPLVTLEELQTNVRTLKKTGFWRYAGQMFSFLRPQVGTPYVTLLRRHNLLGALQINTAEYEALYQDQRVAQIAQQCKTWNKKYHHLYMMLRNLNRSDLGTGAFTHAIEHYRYLQISFLEALLANIPEQQEDFQLDSRRWGFHMAGIAQDICFSLQKRRTRTVAENELLKSASLLFLAAEREYQSGPTAPLVAENRH